MTILPELIWESIQERQKAPAFWYKEDGAYTAISYEQFGNMLVRMSEYLENAGIKSGDKVALMSTNRYEWAVIDLAVQSLGAILVPLYPNITSASLKAALHHSESAWFIIESKDLWTAHKKTLSEMDISFFSIENIDDSIAHFRWLKLAKSGLESRLKHLEKVAGLNENNVISINYTSGTTGEPKGVMLTHKNIASDALSSTHYVDIRPTDRFLSFLPLSHMFERTAGYYVPLIKGASIAYAENMLSVVENAKEIRPTIITTVPRLLEKIYETLQQSFSTAGIIKKRLLDNAKKHGYKYFEMTQGRLAFSLKDKLMDKLYSAVVYAKIAENISPRLRFFISGGAPLNSEIATFFHSLKLTIIEGYGLTETSPVITLNKENANRIGSAGIPLDLVDIKIADDGEILVKGDCVMKGYFKADELTSEVIDSNGYFHSGDIGYLDEQGFLFITDRKKDIIVTAGGKNIAPQPIERLLSLSPYIEQIVIIGNKRKYISALIVPAFDAIREKLNSKKQNENLIRDQKVLDLLKSEIEKRTDSLSNYEKIKQFVLLKDEFSISNNELTSTLKIRRKFIEEKYSDIIDILYS